MSASLIDCPTGTIAKLSWLTPTNTAIPLIRIIIEAVSTPPPGKNTTR
ncbi:MAG: hypothetical protein ACYCT1_19220 [Steroidobacteraceae bacterium]